MKKGSGCFVGRGGRREEKGGKEGRWIRVRIRVREYVVLPPRKRGIFTSRLYIVYHCQPRLPFSPSPSYLYMGNVAECPKAISGFRPSLPPSSVRAPNWKTEAEEAEASLPPGRREGGRRRRSDRIGGKRRRSRKEKKKLCFPLSSFSLADVPPLSFSEIAFPPPLVSAFSPSSARRNSISH